MYLPCRTLPEDCPGEAWWQNADDGENLIWGSQTTLPTEEEKQALIDEVRAAFGGLNREGGVSWSESRVRDDNGSMEKRLAARALDQESGWEALVDDPTWDPEMGVGGWVFLDAIGYRYYLPVAMIRCLDGQGCEGMSEVLRVPKRLFHKERLEQLSGLDLRQRQCVKRFIAYKTVSVDSYEWQRVMDSYWAGL